MNEKNTEPNDGIFIPNEDAANEIPYTGLFPCPKCAKTFSTPQGLRMHNARVHTKTLGSGYKWKTNASKVARRTYQRKLRERYKREGKNSRGQQMPPGWKPRGGVVGTKWTPERLKKFRATMRRKAQARLKPKAERIQIVYPDPQQDKPFDQPPMDLGEVIIPTLKFCPNCGEHLEGWKRI